MLTGNLKQRMKNGEVLNGRHIPIMTEPERIRSILDEGSFDFIATDSQHAPFNEEDSDEDQREDHMILGIKKNNKHETKKKKHKHAHKKNKKNRRLTM